MNKKGNFTPITVFFMVGVIILIWIFLLDPLFDVSSDIAIKEQGLTGFEGLFFSGWSFVILIILFLFIIAVGSVYFGGAG